MVSTGTNVELRKVSGMAMKNVIELAVSGFRTETPTSADIHANPKQNAATTSGSINAGTRPPWNLMPKIRAIASVQ